MEGSGLYEASQQNNAATLKDFIWESISDIAKIPNYFQSSVSHAVATAGVLPNSAAARIFNAAANISEKLTACFSITLPLEEQLAATGAEPAVCSPQVATVLLIRGMCFVG